MLAKRMEAQLGNNAEHLQTLPRHILETKIRDDYKGGEIEFGSATHPATHPATQPEPEPDIHFIQWRKSERWLYSGVLFITGSMIFMTFIFQFLVYYA